MVHQRHPAVAALLVHHLDGGTDTPHLGTAVQAARALEGVQGFEVPSWPALAMGQRPLQNLDEFEIRAKRGGGNMRLLLEWRTIFPCLAFGERARVRSQSGSGAGVALSTVPLIRFDSRLFRTPHSHHRAACARAGVLARRGFAESAAARVCREDQPTSWCATWIWRRGTCRMVEDLKLSLTGCLSIAGHSWR